MRDLPMLKQRGRRSESAQPKATTVPVVGLIVKVVSELLTEETGAEVGVTHEAVVPFVAVNT